MSHGPTAGTWAVEFESVTNRLYVLERSEHLEAWTAVTTATPGVGGAMTLIDPTPPSAQAFYRVARRR
jgi:hypothetical protein